MKVKGRIGMNSKVKSDSVDFFIPFHPQAENSRGMLRFF